MIDELPLDDGHGVVEAAAAVVGTPHIDAAVVLAQLPLRLCGHHGGDEADPMWIECDHDVVAGIATGRWRQGTIVVPCVSAIGGDEGPQDGRLRRSEQLRRAEQVARVARIYGERWFGMGCIAIMAHLHDGDR
jgi:hypothetical protein